MQEKGRVYEKRVMLVDNTSFSMFSLYLYDWTI